MSTRSTPFDELDRQIVATLMDNARASFAEIGTAVGLSASAGHRRGVRRRQAEVITGVPGPRPPPPPGGRPREGDTHTATHMERDPGGGGSTPPDVLEAIDGHVLDEASFTG
ncbi:AsnC family transcriptional regulator, partial [Streptomyces sp. NPDC127110]|uniref:AsnC family transcriptional regulator n=1 Tax=Streptomyces sp. NPDC127110 TaxID=3345362 RepID=UPI0036272697